ncbi:MAG: phage tail tape measure protein, partial [Magnetospirillum sp. WYHS-4]
MADLGISLVIRGAVDATFGNAIGATQKGVDQVGKSLDRMDAKGKAWGGPGGAAGHAAGETGRLGRALAELKARASQAGDALARMGTVGHGAAGGIGAVASRLSTMGTLVQGVTLGAAVKGAMDFEAALTDVGIVAEMTNAELAALRERLIAVGRAQNQSKDEVLRAFRALTSMGLDKDQASAALEPIARTATAANADIEELSRASYVLIRTLNIKPEGLAGALDRLALAGNKGRFELKDMAKFFPQLAPSFRALGMEGTAAINSLGAALQIVSEGASDSSQAATNLLNLFQKMASPESRKNFEKFGIDLTRLQSEALKKGENPINALLDRMAVLFKSAKGDVARENVILGELFQDAQVQAALRPLLQQTERLKALEKELAGSTGGTVENAFARRMGDTAAAVRQARNEIENLGTAVGSALLPPLGAVASAMAPVIGVIANVSSATPHATAAVVGFGVAWKVLGTAVAMSPIGRAIGVIAVAAGLVYDNLDKVKAGIGAVVDAAQPMIDWVGRLFSDGRKSRGVKT